MANYNPERMVLRPDVAHIPRIEQQVRRDLAGYYAMIENLDWNYGRVVRTLEETGSPRRYPHLLFRRPRRYARFARYAAKDLPL